MELTIFDHILVAILFFVLPVLSVTDYRKLKSQLNADKPTARIFWYRSTIAWSWGLTLAVAALWLVYKRSIPQLGLGFESGRGFWAGFAIAVVGCGLLIVQTIALRRDPEKLRAMAIQFESVQAMIPSTKQEAREFAALSITAGICEEILYRGFLIWYVAQFTGTTVTGLITAVAITSIAFGVGHLYQGPVAAAKIVGFAVVAGSIYVVSGSLWLAIALHVFADVAAGLLALAVFRDDDATNAACVEHGRPPMPPSPETPRRSPAPGSS